MPKLFISCLLIGVLSSFHNTNSTECDIANFYSAIEPASGTKVLTSSDDLEDVEMILIPTTLKAGKYVVDVTRKGSNLYEIVDKKIYIETKYCYEYATQDEVVLIVESSYGYTKGKIIF
jgi:hypothetical protein